MSITKMWIGVAAAVSLLVLKGYAQAPLPGDVERSQNHCFKPQQPQPCVQQTACAPHPEFARNYRIMPNQRDATCMSKTGAVCDSRYEICYAIYLYEAPGCSRVTDADFSLTWHAIGGTSCPSG